MASVGRRVGGDINPGWVSASVEAVMWLVEGRLGDLSGGKPGGGGGRGAGHAENAGETSQLPNGDITR